MHMLHIVPVAVAVAVVYLQIFSYACTACRRANTSSHTCITWRQGAEDRPLGES